MADGKVVLISPLLLAGKKAIAEKFRVKPDTVVIWAKKGAPICLAANRYQADYHMLFNWLVQNRPVF